jgi:hypothetical protein
VSDSNNNGSAGGNNGQQRKSNRNRRRRKPAVPQKPAELWRPVAQLPPPAPIRPVGDPTAFIHSVGDPPLQGQGAVAEHYLAAVIERAAGLATALAAAAGLLERETADDD